MEMDICCVLLINSFCIVRFCFISKKFKIDISTTKYISYKIFFMRGCLEH